MTLLAALLLLIVIARWAPDCILAQGLEQQVTKPVARRLAHLTSGEMIVYGVTIVLFLAALAAFGPHAFRGLIFLSPELLVWSAAVVEFGTYADVLVAILGVRMSSRLIDMGTVVRLMLGRHGSTRARRPRMRKDRALPPANDDEPDAGAFAADLRKRA